MGAGIGTALGNGPCLGINIGGFRMGVIGGFGGERAFGMILFLNFLFFFIFLLFFL